MRVWLGHSSRYLTAFPSTMHITIDHCNSPLSDTVMDGRKPEHQNMSYGKATAAVASGAAQWEIEEGKASWHCIGILSIQICK